MKEEGNNQDDIWVHALIDQNRRWLLAFVLSLTGDANAADDLVQQVFLVAFENRAKYDGSRPLGGWLRGIARNIRWRPAAPAMAATHGITPWSSRRPGCAPVGTGSPATPGSSATAPRSPTTCPADSTAPVTAPRCGWSRGGKRFTLVSDTSGGTSPHSPFHDADGVRTTCWHPRTRQRPVCAEREDARQNAGN
ncbi:MAG: hypothetical protein JXR37_00030 [Kiritimatiellae bacterium]|nr:hypothetical protein [Kiritimatiellia bacterium]